MPDGQYFATVADMTDSGLRARKKADTRRALSDAALHLAVTRGVDNMTREDIAAMAGVSLRTFTNYFSGKYEAIAFRQSERLRRSIDEFRRRSDEPLWTAITNAVLAPLTEDLEQAERSEVPDRQELAEIRKLLMRPQIRNAVSEDLFDTWLEAIAERTGTDPQLDLYPRLVVAVVRAIGDAAMDAYVAADPPVAITTLMREGFDAVAAGLPAPARRS